MQQEPPIQELTCDAANQRLNALLRTDEGTHIWAPHLPRPIGQLPSTGWNAGWEVATRKVYIASSFETTGELLLPEFRARLTASGMLNTTRVLPPIDRSPTLRAMYPHIAQPNDVISMFVEDWLTAIHGDRCWVRDINSGRYVRKVVILWETFLQTARAMALEERAH